MKLILGAAVGGAWGLLMSQLLDPPASYYASFIGAAMFGLIIGRLL